VIGKSKQTDFLISLIKYLFIFRIFLSPEQCIAAKMLVFGDIRGHMEPCGCDPRTDVGGVRRLGAALSRYRAVEPSTTVIFTGNLVQYLKMKDAAEGVLPEALALLAPDISLVNEYEINFLATGNNLPNVKWVLSNGSGLKLSDKFSSMMVRGEIEYYGVLDAPVPNLLPVNSLLKSKLKTMSKVKNPENRVLIYGGSLKKLKDFVQDGFFGMVILANQTPLGTEAGDKERSSESTLIKKIGNITAYMTPFGGAGLLRLGGMELVDFPKLILEQKNTIKQPDVGFPLARFFHWLDIAEESAVPDAVLKLTEAARSQERTKFLDLVTSRSKDLPSTQFAGSKSCESCHKTAYELWQKSKHAEAMPTIIAKNRHEDPICVECHVLGFTAKGGYVNEEKSPQFANVQCESCHGPRLEHMKNPTIKMAVKAKDACASCHTPPHSPGFEYKTYWEKIKHK
jgi:hypothetical protein